MNKLIKILLFCSICIAASHTNKLKVIQSSPYFTKFNFNLENISPSKSNELQHEENDSKIFKLDNNINYHSFFYHHNGDINVEINSFDYNIIKGDSSLVPNPKIEIRKTGSLRDYTFHTLSIHSTIETEISKITFNNIEFTIYEIASEENINLIGNSRIFEKMANQLSVNEVRDNSNNYQKPAILYITGGSSHSSPYFNDLVNWRIKKGFEVYQVSTGTIGGSTSSEIKEYITNAYNTFNPTPEFVCLIGDDGGEFNIDSFTEIYSGYNGEGDHPYSQLNGNDILPDILIGRISIRTFDQLNTVIQKILHYEQGTFFDIPNFDNSWLEKAALIADPYPSGNSTIITNQYIGETILSTGFNEIITKYDGQDIDSWMVETINDGVSYLNYRGWWGVSGFDGNEVNSLTNSLKLPFATLITCGTGSFSEEESTLTESIVRSGTVNNPTGAIAAIGTATSGTHTAYNNIIDMGIYHGIFALNGYTAGEALAYGKIALLKTYPNNPNNLVTIFSYWNNLIGDPSLQLWTQNPRQIQLEFSNLLSPGSNNYNIYVSDEEGNPVDNARILITINGENEVLNTITDENGYVYSNITIGDGIVDIFVTGPNIIPYEEEYLIEEELNGLFVNLDNVQVLNSNQENVDILAPNEEFSISFPCINIGDQNTGQLNAYLVSPHPEINITDEFIIIDGIPQFSQQDVGPFNFLLSSNFFNGEEIPLIFIIDDNYENSWSSIHNITVNSYHPQVLYNFENGIISKGEVIENFNFIIKNNGIFPIIGLKAEINYTGSNLEVSSDILDIGDIFPTGEQLSPNFKIYASNFNLNGTIINLPIRLYNNLGYDQTEFFPIQIGNVQSNDPVGPDSYGYFIFDINDNDINDNFIYEWVEIDPYYGGNGVNLNLHDDGNGVGQQINTIKHINLPFNFQFYGETYNSIVVSSNGWISFGETELTSFRNYPIPGPGGPKSMVAAFWDDLKAENNTCNEGYIADCSNDLDCCSIDWIGDGYEDCEDQQYGCDLSCYELEINDCNGVNQELQGKDLDEYIPYVRSEYGGAVFYYYDYENYRFIIEWSDMRTYFSNDEEDFQIILYPKLNNDGEIIINYKTFNNTSVGDYESQTPLHGQFSTIGIEDKSQTDGLQYTYNNIFTNGAGLIENEYSLLITKYYDPYDFTIGDLNNDNAINVSDVVYIISIIMNYVSSTPQLNELGDLNNDYILNVNDIVILVGIILEY